MYALLGIPVWPKKYEKILNEYKNVVYNNCIHPGNK